MKYIFITDIHSNIETLEQLPNRIDEWNDPDVKILFGGDYIDGFHQHGTAGLDVLMFIKKLCDDNKARLVIGNHDKWLIDQLDTHTTSKQATQSLEQWLPNGGIQSLNEWSKALTGHEFKSPASTQAIRELIEKSPYQELIDWLPKQPIIIQEEHLLVAHAGLDLTRPKFSQDTDYVLWAREPYIFNHIKHSGYYIKPEEIHSDYQNMTILTGHTPTQLLSYTPISPLKNNGTIIKLQADKFPTRYLCDGGSKGSPSYDHRKLNVLIINGDGKVLKQHSLEYEE